MQANPRVHPIILNLPYFEDQDPIVLLNDLDNRTVFKRNKSMQKADFNSLENFLKYFFTDRLFASQDSSVRKENFDFEFLEKAVKSPNGPEGSFYDEYISPVLESFDKESDPEKILDVYNNSLILDKPLPEDYYLPTKSLTNSSRRGDNESLKKLTSLFGEGDDFGQTDNLTVFPEIKDIVSLSFDEYDDYLDSIKEIYGDDVPKAIKNLIEDIEEQREKVKESSLSHKVARIDFDGINLGDDIGEKDISVYTWLNVPKAMSRKKGSKGGTINLSKESGKEYAKKLLSNKSNWENMIAPTGGSNLSGPLALRNIIMLLLSIAEEQGVDYKVESGAKTRNGESGLGFHGKVTDPETGEETDILVKDYTYPYKRQFSLSDSFFSDPDIEDAILDNGGAENLLRKILKNPSKKYTRRAGDDFLLNKKMFLKQSDGTSESSSDDFSQAGETSIEVRNFIEKYRKTLADNSDNYYIDSKLVKALENGDTKKINRFLFTNRNGDIDVRRPSKSNKTGLRYEHTVPVLFLARVMNLISQEWNKKVESGEISEQEAESNIKEYSQKLIDKLYTITWLNLYDDGVLDTSREKSDSTYSLYNKLGLVRPSSIKSPIAFKPNVSIEDFYDNIDDVTEEDVMERYHMTEKPIKLDDFFKGGDERVFDNIKKADTALDIGVRKENKQPLLTSLIFGYYG